MGVRWGFTGSGGLQTPPLPANRAAQRQVLVNSPRAVPSDADHSHVMTARRRLVPALRGSLPALGRVALCVVTVGCMSAAAVSFANASEASERSESNRATADEIALVALRTRTDALFSDDADGRILVELDAVELPTAGVARDARVVALASIVDDLDALASSPSGRVASEARMLRDALSDAGLTEDDPDVETLAEVATTARLAVRRSPSAPEVAALEALSATGRLTRLVVKDAIVADALRSDADLSARLDRFFAGAATYLPDRDPVLGPLDDRPVAGAPGLADADLDLARAAAPLAVEAIERAIADSVVVATDRWLDRWTPSRSDTAPVDTAELVADASEVSAFVDTVIRSELDEARAERTRLAGDADAESARWTTSAIALSALTAVLLVLVVVSVVVAIRSSRARSRRDFLDELTGVATRRALEERAERAAETATWSHTVAVVRLDGLELVNDAWGRDAGDRLLVETASRLRRFAVDDAVAFAGDSMVARLGGDEFTLWLGSPQPIDPDRVRAALDALWADEVEIGEGLVIPVPVAVGLSSADATATLDDLIAAADLAVGDPTTAGRVLDAGAVDERVSVRR